MAQVANDKPSKLAVADQVAFVTILVENIQPYTGPDQINPAVQYCQEIFPVLAKLVEAFSDFMPILERVCRCWRHMVHSYRSGILPLLPTLAENLSSGFAKTRQGCFLFASGSIVREFCNGTEHVDDNTSDAIFSFYEQQTITFLTALSDLTPEELPDVIEDFFRLTIDVLLYYPVKTISCQYIKSILSAANTSLTLLKEEPLISTLHFFRDFLAYGTDRNPSSSVDGFDPNNPPEVQNAVKTLLSEEGSVITQRILTGMMYSFPRDCLPDASGVLLGLFQIMPEQTANWVAGTISMLPQGSVTPQESERLLGNIQQCVQAQEMRRVRTVLQDFTTSYRRRNVAPREGLGRLEATKFRFAQ
jgi:transportin-3